MTSSAGPAADPVVVVELVPSEGPAAEVLVVDSPGASAGQAQHV